jgi:hypothetical protein
MRVKSTTLVFLAASVALGFANSTVAEPSYLQINVLSRGMNQPSLLQTQQQKARLKLFVERLRAELKVNNLGEANVGCDRCGELVEAEAVQGKTASADPLLTLKFALFRGASQLEAFARSYDFVQASELGANAFAMDIEGGIGSAACTQTQLNNGCKNRPLCIQTAGCDKPYGGSCDICQ